MAGEFELRRISSVVLVPPGEGIGGDSTGKIGGKGVDNRGCGSVQIRARLRAESSAEAGRRTPVSYRSNYLLNWADLFL